MINLVEDLLFQRKVFKRIMFEHNIFPDAFHGVKLLSMAILDKEDFTESALSNNVDHLEIFELDLYLSCSSLEQHLRLDCAVSYLIKQGSISLG